MNSISLKIAKVTISGGVMLVDLDWDGLFITALLIESSTRPSWMTEGNEVLAIFKETEVSVCKGPLGNISLRNRIPCKITDIINGDILCKLTLHHNSKYIGSVITKRSSDLLNLELHDEIIALIKANEITLMEKPY